MTYNFRNLVFEGGGVKGIAYLGALEVLEERGILTDIERIGGGVLDNYPIKLFDRKKYLRRRSKNYADPEYYKRINRSAEKRERPISKYVLNKETLGFRLDTRSEIAMFRDHAEPQHHKIDDFFDYSWALIHTLLEAQLSYHLHGDDWSRTIYIDSLGVKTTDFDLSDETKKALVASGKNRTLLYFEWHDAEHP